MQSSDESVFRAGAADVRAPTSAPVLLGVAAGTGGLEAECGDQDPVPIDRAPPSPVSARRAADLQGVNVYLCEVCGVRPGEKTDSTSKLVCLRCAKGSGATVRKRRAEIGRNDPCPCGSGKKFKRCCLRPAVRTAPLPLPLPPPGAVSLEGQGPCELCRSREATTINEVGQIVCAVCAADRPHG